MTGKGTPFRISSAELEAIAAIVGRAFGSRLVAIELLEAHGIIWLRVDLEHEVTFRLALAGGEPVDLESLELVEMCQPWSTRIH